MTRFLLDSTAVWRLQRSRSLSGEWADEIDLGALSSCGPQRIEFLRSARRLDEFEAMSAMFDDLYPDVTVPKSVWRWIESAQYRMAARGHHQGMSVVDWLVAGTAAHHGLVVLHDDRDFDAAARVLPDVQVRNVHAIPGTSGVGGGS